LSREDTGEYLASTLLDIKNFVADEIGTGDGSTSVSKRDRLINHARKKFYSEKQWSFLRTEGATLTFTAQVASLPTDYNIKFDPIAVYSYTGNSKYSYSKVAWDDLVQYGTGDYVYAIDKVSREIKISQTESTLLLDYTNLPADKATDTSDNTDEEPVDDITPIGLLATAMWYLSSRQQAGKYQLFKDEYDKELAQWKQADAGSQPIKFFRRKSWTGFGYGGK
jgi:hypothetical protein